MNMKNLLNFTKILIIDPDNEKVKKSRAKLLSESPTISTNDSEYDVMS